MFVSDVFFCPQYKAELVSDFSKNALPHFHNGTLKTIVHKVFPSLESIGNAHRMMEANTNTGKILLQVSHDSKDEL